jgi:hypothetical protein
MYAFGGGGYLFYHFASEGDDFLFFSHEIINLYHSSLKIGYIILSMCLSLE